MTMPGRNYNPGSEYRYGFNGQERSTEVNDNSFTAEFWEYDSRIGRRWNVDPVLKVWESPYLCFSGNPILYKDENGDDAQTENSKAERSMKKYMRKFDRLARKNKDWDNKTLHREMDRLYGDKSWMWVKTQNRNEQSGDEQHKSGPNYIEAFNVADLVKLKYEKYRTVDYKETIESISLKFENTYSNGYLFFDTYKIPDGVQDGSFGFNANSGNSSIHTSVSQGFSSGGDLEKLSLSEVLKQVIGPQATILIGIQTSQNNDPTKTNNAINIDVKNGVFIYIMRMFKPGSIQGSGTARIGIEPVLKVKKMVEIIFKAEPYNAPFNQQNRNGRLSKETILHMRARHRNNVDPDSFKFY